MSGCLVMLIVAIAGGLATGWAHAKFSPAANGPGFGTYVAVALIALVTVALFERWRKPTAGKQ